MSLGLVAAPSPARAALLNATEFNYGTVTSTVSVTWNGGEDTGSANGELVVQLRGPDLPVLFSGSMTIHNVHDNAGCPEALDQTATWADVPIPERESGTGGSVIRPLTPFDSESVAYDYGLDSIGGVQFALHVAGNSCETGDYSTEWESGATMPFVDGPHHEVFDTAPPNSETWDHHTVAGSEFTDDPFALFSAALRPLAEPDEISQVTTWSILYDHRSSDSDTDGDGVPDAIDNCPAVANASQANNDGDAVGDLCDGDDDNDGLADGSDACALVAEDLDGNQDGDGCPEDSSRNIAVTAFRVPGLAAGGASRSIAIKIQNLGTVPTTAYYEVSGTADYSGCSGQTSIIAPRKSVTVTGCVVSYPSAGTYAHSITAYLGSTTASDPDQFADNNLANNTLTDTTRAR